MSTGSWKDFISDKSIYVLGDYILDQWQNVRAVKIAPDVPAPVWELDGDPVSAPGGAGNAAAQLKYLTRNPVLVTCMQYAERRSGLRTLSRPGGWPVKTRLVQDGHVLARLDDSSRAARHDPPPQRAARLESLLTELGREFADLTRGSAALLSDYGQGFWSDEGAAAAVALCARFRVPTVVDPKPGGAALDAWRGCSVLKLNAAEARHYTGTRPGFETFAARQLRERLGCAVVVTNGAGPVAFAPAGAPAHPEEVGGGYGTPRPRWVSGAGDCFAAYLAASAARCGAVDRAAVERAHAAAAVYVGKPHNAPVHPREAMELAGRSGAREYDLDDPGELAARIDALPAGARVGYVNGCFDLIHPGHVATIDFAARHCDFLVAFVNTCDSVHALKGRRPRMTTAERCRMLAALKGVGAVIPFAERDPAAAFAAVGRCEVLVKGAEYAGRDIAGGAFAERVLLAPMLNFGGVEVHTSEILNRGNKGDE